MRTALRPAHKPSMTERSARELTRVQPARAGDDPTRAFRWGSIRPTGMFPALRVAPSGQTAIDHSQRRVSADAEPNTNRRSSHPGRDQRSCCCLWRPRNLGQHGRGRCRCESEFGSNHRSASSGASQRTRNRPCAPPQQARRRRGRRGCRPCARRSCHARRCRRGDRPARTEQAPVACHGRRRRRSRRRRSGVHLCSASAAAAFVRVVDPRSSLHE